MKKKLALKYISNQFTYLLSPLSPAGLAGSAAKLVLDEACAALPFIRAGRTKCEAVGRRSRGSGTEEASARRSRGSGTEETSARWSSSRGTEEATGSCIRSRGRGGRRIVLESRRSDGNAWSWGGGSGCIRTSSCTSSVAATCRWSRRRGASAKDEGWASS